MDGILGTHRLTSREVSSLRRALHACHGNLAGQPQARS
jgi:hypothetical protein